MNENRRTFKYKIIAYHKVNTNRLLLYKMWANRRLTSLKITEGNK